MAGHPCATGTFEMYCAAMGRDDLLTTRASRRRPRGWLTARSSTARSGTGCEAIRTSTALEHTLADAGFAMGVVRTVREVAATDWATDRGAIAAVSDRRGGTVRIPNSPWRFSAASARARGAPAYRGEHNRDVLAELLGLDDAELDRLEARGVLRAGSPATCPTADRATADRSTPAEIPPTA